MKNYNWKKKKQKENERKERGKGEEKGNSATPANEIQLMKDFHCPSTRTTNSVRLILGTQYSLCENYIIKPKKQ